MTEVTALRDLELPVVFDHHMEVLEVDGLQWSISQASLDQINVGLLPKSSSTSSELHPDGV